MKDHPLTPMRDSNLMRLLAPQVTRDVGLIDRLTVARGVDALRAALAQRRRMWWWMRWPTAICM